MCPEVRASLGVVTFLCCDFFVVVVFCRCWRCGLGVGLVQVLDWGGSVCSTVSESVPGGNRTHTISVNIDRKRHANR